MQSLICQALQKAVVCSHVLSGCSCRVRAAMELRRRFPDRAALGTDEAARPRGCGLHDKPVQNGGHRLETGSEPVTCSMAPTVNAQTMQATTMEQAARA